VTRLFVRVAILVVIMTVLSFLLEQTPRKAAQVAAPTAALLGFDLSQLPSPTAYGNSFWGTRSFHWEKLDADGHAHLLTYLIAEEKLCWSSVKNGLAVNHGCVVVEGAR